MVKKETLEEIVKRVIEADMTTVMELIIYKTELETQRKAAMLQLANQALHHLRLLRGALEVK